LHHVGSLYILTYDAWKLKQKKNENKCRTAQMNGICISKIHIHCTLIFEKRDISMMELHYMQPSEHHTQTLNVYQNSFHQQMHPFIKHIKC